METPGLNRWQVNNLVSQGGMDKSEQRDWLALIEKVFQQHCGKGGFEVLFSEYCSDLFEVLAKVFNLEFFDYREAVMLAYNSGSE